MAFLEIENLSFTYPDCNEKSLCGINFFVGEGDFCLVVGKSGSGKSTLLRLLKKEIAPHGKTEGYINCKAKRVGFVSQNVESNIVTDTVAGELAFALENEGKGKAEISLKLAETASYFNLNDIYNQKTANLSGGTKQILSLAGTVIANPEILVFDEPVSQLDPVSAESFINNVIKLNREQGITVIISEHKIENLFPLADKIVYLNEGYATVFNSAKEFALYLLRNDDEFKSILPSYTQAISSVPVDYISAKKEVSSLIIKNDCNNADVKEEKALTAKNLCFAYKKGQKDILFSLNYGAYKGKVNVILGANGSGKTTLLKAFSGILKCYGGKIKSKGKICYMPQNVKTMFLADTVFEELSGSEYLLKKFKLEKLKYRNPFDLSGGEEQRLALAKIIKTGADILLMDEPIKSVDACFKDEFAQILKELCIQGKTIIIVTHDLEFAGRYADYASLLFDGDIIETSERKSFFAGLDIYTTAFSRLTAGKAVSIDDIKVINE